MKSGDGELTRRAFLGTGIRGACLLGLGGLGGVLASRGQADDTVWQIDPYRCIACEKCATNCVMEVSAVKCFHSFAMCGYCELCTGYFEPEPNALNTGAENQVCPTGAIQRKYVEDPYYQYKIDEALCIGCGKCVKGCTLFGNGSLHLQISQDLCKRCNDCSIARVCPTQAIQRVPGRHAYKPKARGKGSS